MNRRIPTPNIPYITLEMLDVDGIEADDCRVETHVCFGEVGAEVVWWACFGGGGGGGGVGVGAKVSFGAVEGGEEGVESFFVGFLRSVFGEERGGGEIRRRIQLGKGVGGRRSMCYCKEGEEVGVNSLRETSLVDTVVDIIVRPFVDSFDFLPQMFGVKINLLVLLGQKIIELIVEHADDFTRLHPKKKKKRARNAISQPSTLFLTRQKSMFLQVDEDAFQRTFGDKLLTSLLTIFPCFTSNRSGTVKRPS